MLINVEIGYCYGEAWEKVDWPKVRENYPKELPEEKPKNSPLGYDEVIRLTTEEATALTEAGLKLTLKALPGAMLTKMKEEHSWEYGQRVKPEDLQTGNAVQIAVPDMALMYIDEVQVAEDLCTDELQRLLDDRWRILAVCPPNAQRRPTYVLGRRKPKDPFD